jgi:alpha-mannosidase
MHFYTVEKLSKQLPEIRAAVYRGVMSIPRFKFCEGDWAGAERPDFHDEAWADFQVGDSWGGYDVVAWFRARVAIPPGWQKRKLALRFLVGPRDGGDSTAETMLYVNGRPLQAFDAWHEEAWLPPEFLQGGEINVALKAWSGVLGVPDRRRFKAADLVWLDEGAERLFFLAGTVLQAVIILDETDLRRVRLLQALNEAFYLIDFTKTGSAPFYNSLLAAGDQLDRSLAELAHDGIKPVVTAVGHAHIDMAWLWRLSHTREKAARTFATVLHLMRQYPEYRFVHSSPQLYLYLKEDYPDIFAAVREKIAAGEWEVTGATWIEPDTNLPGGESLVRQFLYGIRAMRQEFGVDMKLLWLPDVFGYSYALPQIIRKCGVRYFMTTKLSWSQFNRFPYDTFRWRGLDGTEVLTHFVTTPEETSPFYTYNGQLRPSDVRGIWQQYRQKEVNDDLLLLFGWGDGGGGPTPEMLESARVLANLPGMPKVRMGNAEPYFAALDERVAKKQLPVWDGELYLEYHRGTYTSQAYNKRANRLSEILYHNAEWLSAMADVLTGEGAYPAAALQRGWELLLLNQFHDILPGSSIRQVYEDSRRDYDQIAAIGQEALAQAQQRIVAGVAGGEEQLVVFNPLPWSRDSLVELPWSEQMAGRTILNPDERPSPVQLVEDEAGKRVLLRARDLPSLGYQAYPVVVSPAESAPGALVVTPQRLENDHYRLELNDQGQLLSLFDKHAGREALVPGRRANVFQVFEDKPLAYDAWDIEIYYQEKMREIGELVEAVVEEEGPLRGVLRLQWRYYDSTISQRLTIYHHSPRIDFRTLVDWQERQALLKVAFPLNVRTTHATFEIQFGAIERPTHWNTSWDYARFEQVGHKWVDLSEGNYGVALLNDCKYGHDVKENVLRLTLIKSAVRPDPEADRGRHEFTYSLLPHQGNWQQGRVVGEAYALNYPSLPLLAEPVGQEGVLPVHYSFVAVDGDHVIIESVKKAEEGDAWIVRVYECKQFRSEAVTLTFGRPLRRAVACNLIEEEEIDVAYEGQQLTFAIGPFEIKSFKIWLE